MSSAMLFVDGVPPPLLGCLQDSGDLLATPLALGERFAEQGYLYCRDALDREAVLAARKEVAERLVEVGELKPPADEAIATGTSRRRELFDDLGAFWRSVSEGAALRRVTHGGAIPGIADAVLGEAARAQDFIFMRAVPFGRCNGAHCDSPFFTRKTTRVITFWIPLGDVDSSEGPLYIVENSHRFDDMNAAIRGFDVAADPSRRATLEEDAASLALKRGSRLLTSRFAAGDVLIFGMYTWHGSFENRSPAKRVRLSVDVRYQAACEPLDRRYFGPDPTGTTGAGYGELNGAKPLTDEWHIR